ncbi:MAG TPA: YihY/virulence factor BrkB family protein [Amnibacterium sp.]|nr:YihY/virulence factor BrkB family protein [Amnibacterium sp.]
MTDPDAERASGADRGLLTVAEWRHVFRRTWLGFLRHRGVDAGAALTYLSFLALFPIALSAVSALSLVTHHGEADETILAVMSAVAPPSGIQALREPLRALATIPLPGLALAIGVLLTLWAVSAYAASFGRALNALYGVEEGRPMWKVRVTMLLLALPLSAGGAVVATIVLTTPRLGRAVAARASVDDVWTIAWQVLKWPLLLAVLVLMLGALYRWTPNVRRHRGPISWGPALAITGWAVTSTAFALYVTRLGRFSVYGWMTGALVITLYLFLANLVLVLGASLDIEVVRMHQIRAGMPAEQRLAVVVRDAKRSTSLAERMARAEAESHALRVAAEARAARRRTPGDTKTPAAR